MQEQTVKQLNELWDIVAPRVFEHSLDIHDYMKPPEQAAPAAPEKSGGVQSAKKTAPPPVKGGFAVSSIVIIIVMYLIFVSVLPTTPNQTPQ